MLDDSPSLIKSPAHTDRDPVHLRSLEVGFKGWCTSVLSAVLIGSKEDFTLSSLVLVSHHAVRGRMQADDQGSTGTWVRIDVIAARLHCH